MIEARRNVATESGAPRIFFVRGNKVMLDEDLAALHEIETKALNYVVARNIDCLTEDLVFRLNEDEFAELKSRFAISSREAPRVFTGQGLALLSSILIDERENRRNRESCAPTPTCSCRS